MRYIEVYNSDCSKFFGVNTICYSHRGGYVSVDGQQLFVAPNTKMVITNFDVYKNVARVIINGKTYAEVSYEYLTDCVKPVNVDVSQPITGVQIIQKVHKVFNNETFVKLICAALLFVTGLLVGVVF